ncbi:MAG: ribosome small subunit-dependent GTPase A [Bacteroidia bacterium]|nr:ribosome small subunit-dependent GTPase A [Bacteroidia bacterium]
MSKKSAKGKANKKTKEPSASDTLVMATVIRTVGSSHRVRTEDGRVFEAIVRGKFRIANLQTTNPVAVGDLVMTTLPEADEPGIIWELIPRKNYLLRKAIAHARRVHILAANLDQAVLIFTLKEPRTAPGFADRFLVVCEAYDIPASIFINKTDLLTTPEELALLEATCDSYRKAGYDVYPISALNEEHQQQVKSVLANKLSFIGGHSGAGKTTLVNLIDPTLDLKTGEISEYSGKGTHTTTHAEMHDLAFGGAIIDSPGIKEWGLVEMTPGELGHYFPEIRSRIGECRFQDCLHKFEPACAIRTAANEGEISISRYEGYLRLLEEIKEDKEF